MDEELIREQLRSVPYELLASELAKRNAAKRKAHQMGGRPPKLRPCPNGCGQYFGAAAMREHKRECLKAIDQSRGNFVRTGALVGFDAVTGTKLFEEQARKHSQSKDVAPF